MKTIDEVKLSKCYTCSCVKETTFKKSSKRHGTIIVWCRKKGRYPQNYDYNGCEDYRTKEEQKIISDKLTKRFKKWKVKKQKEDRIKEKKRDILRKNFCERCEIGDYGVVICPNLEIATNHCDRFIDATEKRIVDRIERKDW